jgi:hypothetical protein
MQCVRDKIGSVPESSFKELKSLDFLVTMDFAHHGDGNGVARGNTVVDASVEECAVWEMCKASRENWKHHVDFGGLERTFRKVNDHGNIYHVVYDLKLPGLSPREWVTLGIWKWKNTSSLEVFAFSADLGDFPTRENYVRASSLVHYTYDELEMVSGTPQTRVTMTQSVDLKGVLPKWAADGVAQSNLMYLSKMRLRFDQSSKIDALEREKITSSIRRDGEVYTQEENEIVEEGLSHFGLFEGEIAKELKMSSRLTIAKAAFTESDSHVWGWATTIVRGSPEDILAFASHGTSRANRYEDDIVRTLDEVRSSHNQLLYVKKRVAKPLTNRDFLARAIWKKTSTGFVMVTSPEESDKRRSTEVDETVRGTFPSALQVTRLNARETELVYVIHPDFGGKIPSFITNPYVSSNLGYLTLIRETFQNLRGLEQWDAGDGKAVGEAMVTKTEAEALREKKETKVGARLRVLFKKDKGLGEVQEKYVFFQTMMERVVLSKLRPARDVSSRLCNFSIRDGEKAGSGLAASLASNLTAEAAVDEWIGKYPALKELDRTEIWFRPMMDVVASRLLNEVPWGLKMRVFIGAGLSVLDVASDINVIFLYSITDGQEKYAMLLLMMLVANLAFQSIAVYAQNRAKPWRVVRELLFVLLGLKPG